MASDRGRVRAVLTGFGLWTVYGLYSASLTHSRFALFAKPMSWRSALILECSYAYIAAIVTPAVVWWAREFRLERGKLLRNAPLHGIASFVFAAVTKIAWDVLNTQDSFAEPHITALAIARSVARSLDNGVSLYWLIVLFTYAIDYNRRYRASLVRASELSAQLARAQLQALRMQLHPHFLFNTLHAISELLHENPSAAERMIVGLSRLLRVSLDNSVALEMPLEQELEFSRLYLDIEQTRFDSRLRIEYFIAPDTLGLMVPNLILQPIIENAIRHGIARRAAGGRLQISSAIVNEWLLLTVSDDGPGPGADLREGIGLTSTRARLQQLYGAQQSFEFSAAPGGGACVGIRIPLRRSSELAAELPGPPLAAAQTMEVAQ